jgi:SAM-dependent methyltransferase
MTAQTPASGPLALAYWQTKARTYPRPDSHEATARAAALHVEAEALGLRIGGRILDVGAGAGAHALAFAARGAEVTATDLSPAMLEPLRVLATGGISIHVGDFPALDLDALGWRKAFDLVWSCMTPVSGDPEGLARLEAASRGQVCCVTWGARRDDPLIEQVFALHGVPFRAPAWRETLVAWTEARSRLVRHRSLPRAFDQRTPVPDLVDDFAAHLRWLGVEPDTVRIARHLDALAVDGVVTRRVVADTDIWLWSVV